MIASNSPLCASVRAAAGISHEPGTRTIRICSRSAPLRSRASSAPCSKRSVITAFHRATTMANRSPSALRSPSSAIGLPRSGSCHSQKATEKPGTGSTVNSRDFQCVSSTLPMRLLSACFAIHCSATRCRSSRAVTSTSRSEPTAGSFPVTNSRLPSGARNGRPVPPEAPETLVQRRIVPAAPRLKAQRGKEAHQIVEMRRRVHRAKKSNALDHDSRVSGDLPSGQQRARGEVARRNAKGREAACCGLPALQVLRYSAIGRRRQCSRRFQTWAETP